MGKLQKLEAHEIATELAKLDSWTLENGKLHRELTFANFIQAFGFMTQIAIIAETQDHHPEWFNVYSRVIIDLTTHDADGISTRDFKLARAIDSVAASMTS